LVIHALWSAHETQIIKSIINKKSHQPIVGVPALCSCNFANISDFSHVAVLLRIVFPAFRFLSNLIYNGYSTIAPIKVARVKLKINIKLFNILDIIL
jgi:hypothetical protein